MLVAIKSTTNLSLFNFFKNIEKQIKIWYNRHMSERSDGMPRPQRCRRVCSEPQFLCFSPGGVEQPEENVLTVDEYEVIRLVDYEKKSHEQCAAAMEISRTTVTEIYEKARYKIAECLVQGKQLSINGGNYQICPGQRSCFGKPCRKERILSEKGEHTMRIAVTYENGEIFQHFGHTKKFKVYDIEDGEILSSRVVDSEGFGHGALAEFLFNNGIDILICSGIGGGAQTALRSAGIKLYAGVSGSADDAVQSLLDGTLNYNPNVMCNHHGHEEGHSCGNKGCH